MFNALRANKTIFTNIGIENCCVLCLSYNTLNISLSLF
jgi:hypothetical protein